MATYGKRSKTKNITALQTHRQELATGRFTRCQAWASLRPFNIGRWPMSRAPAIYPGSRSRPRGPTQDDTGHRGAGPRGLRHDRHRLHPLRQTLCRF